MVDGPGLFLKEHRGRLPEERKKEEGDHQTHRGGRTSHTDGGRLPNLAFDDEDVLGLVLAVPLVVRGFRNVAKVGEREAVFEPV